MTEVKSKILIIDPDGQSRQKNKALLKTSTSQYEILEAKNEAEALEALSKNIYALAISDFDLQGSSGMTLLKHARERGVHTPFLFLSPPLQQADLKIAVRHGAIDFLEKPVHEEKFISMTKRALRLNQLLSQELVIENELLEHPEVYRGNPSLRIRTLSTRNKVFKEIVKEEREESSEAWETRQEHDFHRLRFYQEVIYYAKHTHLAYAGMVNHSLPDVAFEQNYRLFFTIKELAELFGEDEARHLAIDGIHLLSIFLKHPETITRERIGFLVRATKMLESYFQNLRDHPESHWTGNELDNEIHEEVHSLQTELHDRLLDEMIGQDDIEPTPVE